MPEFFTDSFYNEIDFRSEFFSITSMEELVMFVADAWRLDSDGQVRKAILELKPQ